MFKTQETKTLPLYALALIGLNAVFGFPANVDLLKNILNGHPFAWTNYQLIIALGCYCFSQTIQPGGHTLREALFGKPVQISTTLAFRQILFTVSFLWMAIVVFSIGNIWYKSGFNEILGIWTIWPELLYTLSVSFASVLLIAAFGLFINFLNGWVVFQVLSILSVSAFDFDIIENGASFHLAAEHPFPLFASMLKFAQTSPTYNLIALMACPALFAFAYKFWREKQWYLRKA